MNKIIIANKEELNTLIKEERKRNPFSHTKFFSLNEFLNSYPYTYETKALEYIMDTTNVTLEIAKIYLENLIKYDTETKEFEKGIFLSKLKKELEEKKLIKKNNTLEAFLSKNELILYNVKETKYLNKLISKFNPKYIQKENKNYIPKVYLLNTIEEEIAFVGEQIINLLKKEVSIEHIYISNIPKEYHIPLKRIFKMLHIPLSLKETTTLNQTTIGRVFLENIHDLEKGIETIKALVLTEEDESIYNQILSITNNHILERKKEEFIIYDLSHTKRKPRKLLNTIKEIDFKKEEVTDGHYVFLMSFTKDTIPKIKKDEDYLSDKVKKELDIDTSTDLNQLEKETIKTSIKNIKNCVITLKNFNNGKECYPSEILETMNLEIENGTLSYTVSKEYNKFILGGLLDKYMKYGTKTDMLLKLAKTYQIPYQTYNNQFTKVPKQKIWKEKELRLSYTHLDTYNKCAFSYYIKHILHLDSFEETFQIKIGNIFHKVLEEREYENFDFDSCFDEISSTYPMSKKERILLRNLKEEFRFTINTLKKRKNFSSLTNHLREHTIEIDYPNEIKTTIKGIIDKVSFERIDGEIYYTITDYKSGALLLEEEKMPLGFHLQLPTYIYLLKQEEYFKNAHLGGFYLQPLLIGNIPKKENENFCITKEKALKMKGFSTSDKNILSLVDSSFTDSNCIKSLKVKADGEFYNYSKILSQEDEETLEQTVLENLQNQVQNITNGVFQINPKIINNDENIACEFCPFKDLCFHEPKDNIYLESDKKFLKKEENHGMDERTGNSNLYEWN